MLAAQAMWSVRGAELGVVRAAIARGVGCAGSGVRSACRPRRQFGVSAGAGEAEPASAAMKTHMATKPRLFPGSKKGEYWEGSFYLFAGSLVFATVAYPYLPNTDITEWARDEAEERNEMRARGEEVQYGMNYAALRTTASVFRQESPTDRPEAISNLSELNDNDDEADDDEE